VNQVQYQEKGKNSQTQEEKVTDLTGNNEELPLFITTLFRDKRFRKFKKLMRELQERAV
jgi:hypothetical protein